MLRYPRIPGPRVEVGEIIPGLHQRSLYTTSVFIVVTPASPRAGEPEPNGGDRPSVALIDSGWRIHSRRLLKFLERLGHQPASVTRLISTHYHLDHIGGMAGLQRATGTPVEAHHVEVPNLRQESGRNVPNPVQQWWLRAMLWPLIRALHPPAIPSVSPLEGGDTLPLLGGARVIHTPGHTPGSISLHFPNEGVLIVGDALQRRGDRVTLPSKYFTSDMDTARESVRKMAALDFDTICFSHFLPMRRGSRPALRSLAEYVS